MNIFRKYLSIPFFLLFLFNSINVFGNSDVAIANIDFYLFENKIVTVYDIVGSNRYQRFDIKLHFETKEGRVITPTSITGDVGFPVSGGEQKKIYWNVFNDLLELTEEIKPVITIVNTYEEFGGPANALLSLAVPGLGDTYVRNTKESLLKPYFITAASYGLVGYGIYQKIVSNDYFGQYENETNQENFDDLYNKANTAHHDFIIFTAIGGTVWLADVVHVALRGKKNTTKNREFYENMTFHYQYVPNGSGVRLVYKF
ncbi:MAG: hypothetical protein JXB49_15395 [Bacteroidales bacterium]|nr:hypothetical protein [Bacteroidales bacterium]MBN2817962.1 hypothetical protein [Bacteroidales bacterium]